MKRIINSYVFAGQGIGLRFVLLVACFFALLLGIGTYVASLNPLNKLEESLQEIAQITVLDGQIVSPIYVDKEIPTVLGTVEFNTAVSFITPDALITDAMMYVTQTQVFVKSPNERVVPMQIRAISQAIDTKNGVYREVKVSQFQDRVFSPIAVIQKVKSLLGLGTIGLGIIVFVALIFDFLLTYAIVIFLNLFMRLKLTIAQLGRLLVVPWTALIIGSFILTAMKKSMITWWIALYIRMTTPSIQVGYSTENAFAHFMPMWWMMILLAFGVLTVYIVWASGLSLYKERRDELFKKSE